MNESNFREITEKIIPRLGFSEGVLDGHIRDLMLQNPGKMTVGATDMIGQDQIRYDLTFQKNEKKPEDPNLYLNTITATMTKADGEERKQSFQYFFGQGFNVEQLNNIMDGRSVYKEFRSTKDNEEYRMWSAIDLNRKDDKGFNLTNNTFENTSGFNLVIEVSKLPLAGNMNQAEKEAMLTSLRNGNEVSANVKMPDGSTQRAVLVALPHINQVAAYDMDGNRLKLQKSTMQAIPLTNAKGEKVDPAKSAADLLKKQQEATTGKGQGQSSKKATG